MQAKDGYLTGQLLIAMPGMRDPRFARSVVYLCAHNAEGAMGLVVNQSLEDMRFADILEELGIGEKDDIIRLPEENNHRLLLSRTNLEFRLQGPAWVQPHACAIRK